MSYSKFKLLCSEKGRLLLSRPFLALYNKPPALRAKALVGKQSRTPRNYFMLPRAIGGGS